MQWRENRYVTAGDSVFTGNDRAIGLDARAFSVAGDGGRPAAGGAAEGAATGQRQSAVRRCVWGTGSDGGAAAAHDTVGGSPGARSGSGPPTRNPAATRSRAGGCTEGRAVAAPASPIAV